MLKKACFIGITGAALSTALLFSSAASAATASYCPADGTVRFGVEPYEATAVLTPIYNRFGKLLSEKLHCNVKIEITSSYTAEIEAMRHGKLEAGEFGPFGFALAKKVAGAQAVAQFGTADGKPVTYWASIVTWKGSGIHNLQDVKGKTFAYSDPASTSGHLMPSYALKQAGIDPQKGVQAFYAGTHTASFEALKNHKVQAGELNSDTKALAGAKGWLKGANFVTLWKSQPLPLDAIAISPKLSKPLRQHLTHALQTLVLSPPIKASAFKILGHATRLVPANDQTYSLIDKVMHTMHITIKDL